MLFFNFSCIDLRRSDHDQHSHLTAQMRVDKLRGCSLEQWSAFHANALFPYLVMDAGGCARVGSARKLGPCTVEEAFDCHERVIIGWKTHDNGEHRSAQPKDGVLLLSEFDVPGHCIKGLVDATMQA